MGNLENDDIDEKASLKTITSEINSNDVIPDDNSVKSDSVQSKPHGERKIKDKLSKKHKHKKSKKSSKNDVDKVEGNSENVNHINGTVNENNINNISEPQANIQESTRTPVIDTIDTNADVHAEDDPGKTNNIESIKSSDHDDINENIASHNDKANRSNEADKSNFITEEDESNKYTNDEISKIDSQTEDLEPNVVEANTSDTSKYETQPVSYDSQIEDIKPEDKNENQSNVEEKDANQPSEESEHKESVDIRESNDPFQNTNDESSNLIELQTPENDSTSNQETGVGSSDEKQSGNEIDTGNHVKKVENKTQEKSSDIPTIPNDYLMTNGMKTSPKLPRRPLKRSVSDNFIIKSTSTSPHPIIDPLPQCNIDIENEVLIQNNINLYKSDDNLRNLTKLEMLKRSISDTLTNLKSKLMRSNKVTNGNLDQNVKLINVGSQSRTLDGAEEDEMIENIKTPLEMKNGSLESVQDSEVNDKDNAWKVERDISNGIDVLRRDGSPGNGGAMGDPSPDVVAAVNDPKNGIVNPAFTPPSLLSQQSTVWTRKQQAVCVRHAFKHYGSKSNPNHVLSNLNMTVAKGTIYGLLGASGCGKTTLLSCIVGRRRLNTGEIWVLGGKPGTKGSGVPGKRVGYMPQEIALYGEFSIKETMMYFGWIFGMETPEIDDRLQFLLNFLDLPSQSRLVKNLSGGQQRRVSFAVALMHDPELLILDEPTVGVDPLLRQSIWNHLVQITKDGNKTVIITTHYIEEARQAHTIGLMRSGRLLAEESPQVLLQTYGCQSLEEVFLKLSRKQGNDATANNVPEVNIANNISLPNGKSVMMIEQEDDNSSCGDCCPLTTKGKTKALLQKNFLRMWRNVGVMLFIFALPVMQVILFCLAIGRDPTGLHLAIVNQEMDWATKACPVLSNCSFTHLSCRYLNSLPNDTIIKDYYPDPESAINAVRVGDAWGALYFTDNFTDALVARMVLGRDADEETLDQSEIRVWLDMSNQQIGLMLNRDLQLSYRDFAQDLLSTCDQNPKIADIPIQFKEPIYGSNDPSFTDFVAPGVILTIVFFLAVALTSSALIIERMEGLLDRSWVAGVTPLEILFSHVITQFVVMCGQTALVLIFMIFVFGVECKGDLLLVIILTILQGLCGMCFGFVISAICELERNAIQLALGSFYPTLLLSGVIWPVEGMPIVLRYISLCLPLTMATTSLRSILTRGWNLVEPDVYLGFISTITWIVLFLTISMLVLKFKRG